MKPEYEIYELSCNTIRERLKNAIRGRVIVGVDNNDILHIHITNDGFEFNYEKSNYLKYVIFSGTEGIVNDVVLNFRKAVIKKYFHSILA